jgi:hypothetical protein
VEYPSAKWLQCTCMYSRLTDIDMPESAEVDRMFHLRAFINPSARVFAPQVFVGILFPRNLSQESHLLTSDSRSSENSCGYLFLNIVTHSGLIMSTL